MDWLQLLAINVICFCTIASSTIIDPGAQVAAEAARAGVAVVAGSDAGRSTGRAGAAGRHAVGWGSRDGTTGYGCHKSVCIHRREHLPLQATALLVQVPRLQLKLPELE